MRTIRHCYMTGQPCSYVRDVVENKPEGAFVISPFSEDFNYIYDYYVSRLNVREKWGGEVRRADSIGRTGYVMCSRICYPIQKSALVIADVTEPNLNVFYELGLACALNKVILLLAHRAATPDHVRRFIHGLGLGVNVHDYESHAPINDTALSKGAAPTLFAEPPPSDRDSIIVFSNETKEYLPSEGQAILYRHHKMAGIIKRVLGEFSSGNKLADIINRARIILRERGATETGHILQEGSVKTYITRLQAQTSAKSGSGDLSQQMRTAAFVFIDTTLRDFESYFWLGTCHGLQRQVIPFSILDGRIATKDLPFDVRTLWHIDGSFKERENIERQVSHILVELIARVVSARELAHRERFWEAMAQGPKLSFCIGTEQSSQLKSKQVVGEWDLRTFQELAAFATRINPSLDVRIEKPAFKKDHYDDAEIDAFRNLLKERVGNSHCVIIGTPDVNPVAEMALSTLTGVAPFQSWFPKTLRLSDEALGKLVLEGLNSGHEDALRTLVGREFTSITQFTAEVTQRIGPEALAKVRSSLLKNSWRDRDEATNNRPEQIADPKLRNTYVAFKNHLFEYYEPRPSSFFYQFDSKEPIRGFMYYDAQGRYTDRYTAEYIARERMEPQEQVQHDYQRWQLVGHLIVVTNPFAAGFPNTDLKAVLLMGVGGPATLGLAHLLTGRVPVQMFREATRDEADIEFVQTSEKFMSDLNGLLRHYGSAEAIIRITVMNDRASRNNAYEDSRQIERIKVAENLAGVRNPKEFHMQQ